MIKKRPTVSVEELLLANTAELAALVELLVRKGLITQAELLEEIHIVRDRQSRQPPKGRA